MFVDNSFVYTCLRWITQLSVKLDKTTCQWHRPCVALCLLPIDDDSRPITCELLTECNLVGHTFVLDFCIARRRSDTILILETCNKFDSWINTASDNIKQERVAGPAPRGEGRRMPSCLPAKIVVAKFNVTTTFSGRRADRPVQMHCRSTVGAGAGSRGSKNGVWQALPLALAGI